METLLGRPAPNVQQWGFSTATWSWAWAQARFMGQVWLCELHAANWALARGLEEIAKDSA